MMVRGRALLTVSVLGILLASASTSLAGGDARGWSDEVLDLASTLPVQDDGRVKPLSTYARFALMAVSESSSCKDDEENGLSAMAWLLDCLFFPEKAKHYPVLLVEDSAVLEAIGLTDEIKKKRDRYSYAEIEPAGVELHRLSEAYAGVPAPDLSAVEEQIMKLDRSFEKLERLLKVTRFASIRFPLQDTPLLSSLFPDAGEIPLSELLAGAGHLRELLTKGDEGVSPGEVLAERRALTRFLQKALEEGDVSFELALLPPSSDGTVREEWFTPGSLALAVFSGTGNRKPEESLEDQIRLLAALEDMAALRERPAAFLDKLREFHDEARRLAEARGEYEKIGLEVFFYELDPFFWSRVLFLIGFLLIAVSWAVPRTIWVYRGVWVVMALATLVLVTGITLRCVIRSRPPVTTNYETYLFVTAIAVLFSLFLEAFDRRRMAIALAAVLGVVGLLLAGASEVEEAKDTMGVLVAVLDSDFWLAVHVTTISIGYSALLLASLTGHVYIFGRLFGIRREDPLAYRKIGRTVYGVGCFGLLFTVVGTLTGGIWANDSWGRFWGWDPKENGALLICLWGAALIHARLGKYIRDLGVCMAAVFGGIVVLFAWEGVNLLGKGLHTYGFASGKLRTLIYVGVIEMLVIGLGVVVWWRDHRADRSLRPPPLPDR